MGELLGALGLAWPRLLLYPGGLFALLAARALWWWLRGSLRSQARQGNALIDIMPPLVAITLLPLAPARSFPYGLDLVIALALIEWPALVARARAGALERDALVRAYLPLLVAAGAMAAAVGGLELTRLLRLPDAWPERALLAAGVLLWLAALPRLLRGGPADLAARLRALGLLLIAALPLLGALAALVAPMLPADLAGWLLPPAAILLAALALGGAIRLRRWARPLQLALVMAIVVLLAWLTTMRLT